jgi:site-specific DNA-methyltransferase (adenine-specific)
MDVMKTFPDGHFDLAVVDPPYGIGESGGANNSRGTKNAPATQFVDKGWDKSTPPIEYFDELRRVSKNQIIWGANHMMEKIMRGSPSWIIWDKDNIGNDFADAELAYTSHAKAARIFKFRWNGMLQGDMKNKETRIHPTQKPVALYKWLLANYATPGMKVLDTHLGSGSVAIAAHYAGMHLTACEIDADYYEAAKARISRETSQTELFIPHNVIAQAPLPAEASVDHRVEVVATEKHRNWSAGRGCSGATCSASSFLGDYAIIFRVMSDPQPNHRFFVSNPQSPILYTRPN